MWSFLNKYQNQIIWAAVAIVFGFFSFFLLYRLGVHPYIDWDESYYAQVAKEMYQNREFFNLTFWGKHWFEKPPLAFWLVSLSYAIGGISEWTARLPVVMVTLATVLLSLRWVYELKRSPLAVLLTMTAFCLSYPFITGAYFLNLDSIVGLFILLTAYSWHRAQTDSRWYWVWGAALGLGVLTKSIVALFILFPIAASILIYRQFAFLRDRNFWYGVGLFLLVVLPWHIYQTLANGQAFWNVYFVYHILKRAGSNLENNGGPFIFFIRILFWQYYEAMIVFGGSVLYALWGFRNNPAVIYLWLCFMFLLLILSSSITKLAPYIIIAIPFLVMITGLSLEQLLKLVDKVWLRYLVVAVLVPVIVFSAYSFNSYKLAKGENTINYVHGKRVGLYLKDNYRDWPVYIYPKTSERLAISHYAERLIEHTDDKGLVEGLKQEVFYTLDLGVYVGDGYIVILWK